MEFGRFGKLLRLYIRERLRTYPEVSPRIAQDTLDAVRGFVTSAGALNGANAAAGDGPGGAAGAAAPVHMVHLAYIMYVPGLSVEGLGEGGAVPGGAAGEAARNHIVRLSLSRLRLPAFCQRFANVNG